MTAPLITVAAAASMNGYPSAISALTDKGIKITEPCQPPVAVICDPDILASAPAKMTGAGFGDLLSKNASTADWHVSHILMGDYFCPFAAQLAEEAVSRCLENREAIRENRPRGIAVLIDALMRSGISMKVAGSSAPASGGEHLMSHLWDMTAHWTGRTPALHGAQTGVTTLVSLKLYEKLLALDTDQVRDLCNAPIQMEPKDRFEQRIRQTFRDLADGVIKFAMKKHLDEKGVANRRGQILDKWEEIRKAARGVVIPAKASKDHLKAAGAVFRASDLGISKDELLFAYQNARYIRDRYTVLDLAADLGVLEEWTEDVLDAVRAEPGDVQG